MNFWQALSFAGCVSVKCLLPLGVSVHMCKAGEIRAGKMARWVKYLLCVHEDLSLDAQNSWKPTLVPSICKPRLLGRVSIAPCFPGN